MNKLLKIFKIPDLRNKIFFVLVMLVIYRIAAAIPIPTIDPLQLQEFFDQNQLFGFISVFTGGALDSLSIAMLGLSPYITASIVMQLATMIFPQLEQMYKYEGEAGRAKFNQYSRLLTVPLALLQGYGFLVLLSRQGAIGQMDVFGWVASLSAVVAGSIFLMWLGELITEKNIGNGVSLMILAGIVAGAPVAIRNAVITYDPSQFFTYAAFVLVSILVIAGVVYINEAQRNIPVNYARRVRGFKQYGGVSTYLPMRVNNAGVIPIIFALSILLFPSMIANFFQGTSIPVVSSLLQLVGRISEDQLFFTTFYFLLVFVFTFFYTAVTFDPKSISENIQKQGGYIPGIRPGDSTVAFLNHLLMRVTLVGAVFLGLIAILPNIFQGATGLTAFTIGGTSILIVVAVAIEMMKQIDAQLSMYEY